MLGIEYFEVVAVNTQHRNAFSHDLFPVHHGPCSEVAITDPRVRHTTERFRVHRAGTFQDHAWNLIVSWFRMVVF